MVRGPFAALSACKRTVRCALCMYEDRSLRSLHVRGSFAALSACKKYRLRREEKKSYVAKPENMARHGKAGFTRTEWTDARYKLRNGPPGK